MSISEEMGHHGVLRPQEIAMLTQVYDDLVADHHYLGNKPAREALARRILHHFRLGVVTVEDLKQACRHT